MKAMLILEDGSFFEGISIGSPGEKIGRVVLNTAVVGYQEMMTDPANAGKILVLTYPLIGNYGIAKKFYESKKCFLGGLVIKEESRIYSNWQAEGPLASFIKEHGLIAISEIDTRTLAVNIRDNGEMLGIISTAGEGREALLKKLAAYKKDGRLDYIKEISVKTATEIKASPSSARLGILDLGVTNSIIKQLKALGCEITLLPYNTLPEKILTMNFDGLIVSGGPEEDVAIEAVVKTVKDLIGKLPILGISTGHEVIGLALGAKLRRMRVGHHGVNYPVKSDDSYKGEITVQNHSFIIDDDSIKKLKEVKITLRNINDNSIEEMEGKALKFISVQYIPSSPGFDEVNPVFRRFLDMAARNKGSKRKTVSPSHGEAHYAKA